MPVVDVGIYDPKMKSNTINIYQLKGGKLGEDGENG